MHNFYNLVRKIPMPVFLCFSIVLWILYTNTFHEKYPDEFDNILGGKYILHGILPYSGFFSHHGPVAYFLAAFFMIFSGNSFVLFRIIYCVFLFLLLVASYIFFRKNLGEDKTQFYLFFVIILSLSSVYFWGHMFIADSLSGFLFIPLYGLLFLKLFYRKHFFTSDLILLSLLSSLIILNTLTFVYLIFFLLIVTFYSYFFRQETTKRNITKKIIIVAAIFALPYIIFGIYLFLTGGLNDYIQQSIIFNQKYYIYNYPTSENTRFINPIRFASIIGMNFYNNFTALLTQVKDFNFSYPFNITLAISNITLLIFLIMKRKFLLMIMLVMAMIYSNARTNPLESREIDYQSAIYIILSLFNMSFVIKEIYFEINKELLLSKKIIFSLLFLLLSVYTFFFMLFISSKFLNKTHDKYMGKAPKIYDRPIIAPILNSVVMKDEYTWAGPLEFEELLYLQGKPASQIHFLVPGMGRAKIYITKLIKDFENTKPKLVWFDKDFQILGGTPNGYGIDFVNYLDYRYMTLHEYRENNIQYAVNIDLEGRKDIETMLYIRKDNKDEMVNRLIEANIIKRIDTL